MFCSNNIPKAIAILQSALWYVNTFKVTFTEQATITANLFSKLNALVSEESKEAAKTPKLGSGDIYRSKYYIVLDWQKVVSQYEANDIHNLKNSLENEKEFQTKMEEDSVEYFGTVNSETIPNSSEQIRTSMLDMDRSGSNRSKLFKKLQKKDSVVSYSKFIGKIIWILYKCTKNDSFKGITDALFMQNLSDWFQKYMDGVMDFHGLVFNIFTQKNDLKSRRFDFALVKALIFYSFTSKNVFVTAENLTPFIAKLEYAIRCSIIQEIMQRDDMYDWFY